MCIGYWVAFLYLPIILLVTFASVKVEVLFIGNIPRMNENGQRKREKRIILSNLEKKIILLSAQGVQEQEIAKMLHISTPLLKFRKRELFIRLKVNNISKAILRAINYHLL